MPHGLVFSSRMRCNSRPSISRSATIWCRSCRPIDSRSAVCALSVMACVEILHFQNRFLRVPHHPEHDRVHVHRHRVARQRGFRRNARHAHPLVHEPAQRIHDGNDHEQPRPAQPAVPPQAQHRHLFPLVGHADGEQQVHPDQRRPRSPPRRLVQHDRNRRARPRAQNQQSHSHAAQPQLSQILSHRVISCPYGPHFDDHAIPRSTLPP